MVTIWLTGLPGAGKSTLANLAARELRTRGDRVEVLDGDALRETLSADLGYSPEDRGTHANRTAFVANLLSRNGVVAIVALISPYRQLRAGAKALIEAPFLEVFVDCPLDECIRRDPKGLYARAFSTGHGGLTGVTAPYEPPIDAALVIRTDREDAATSTTRLLGFLDSHPAYRAR